LTSVFSHAFPAVWKSTSSVLMPVYSNPTPCAHIACITCGRPRLTLVCIPLQDCSTSTATESKT
jgi:hypothetical protein